MGPGCATCASLRNRPLLSVLVIFSFDITCLVDSFANPYALSLLIMRISGVGRCDGAWLQRDFEVRTSGILGYRIFLSEIISFRFAVVRAEVAYFLLSPSEAGALYLRYCLVTGFTES